MVRKKKAAAPADEGGATLWQRLSPFLGYLLALLASAVAGYLGYRTPDLPPPPVWQVPSQGWVEDSRAVLQTLAGLETPLFADTPAGKAALAEEEEDVFLWKAQVKVLGAVLPPRNQLDVGSCVSFGTGSAVETLQCVQIATWDAARGPPPGYKDLAQEVIYAGSRVEVGGGRIRGDGSVGAWAAQFVSKWGVIPRGTHGRYDLSAYDTGRCREWGQRGVPDDLEPVAREHPVRAVALVRSAAEAKKALRQGYPIAVCSNQGFSQTRDAQGFCAAQGSWAHCMEIEGYQGGARPGFWIRNSWGTGFHRGPVGKGDPSPAGFWADERVVDRMLSQGDSWAFSDLKGFPSRKPLPDLDWYVRLRSPLPAAPFAARRRADNEPVFLLAL